MRRFYFHVFLRFALSSSLLHQRSIVAEACMQCATHRALLYTVILIAEVPTCKQVPLESLCSAAGNMLYHVHDIKVSGFTLKVVHEAADGLLYALTRFAIYTTGKVCRRSCSCLMQYIKRTERCVSHAV